MFDNCLCVCLLEEEKGMKFCHIIFSNSTYNLSSSVWPRAFEEIKKNVVLFGAIPHVLNACKAHLLGCLKLHLPSEPFRTHTPVHHWQT